MDDETFQALLKEHGQISQRIRSHVLTLAYEAAQEDNADGVRQAADRLQEYSGELEGEQILIGQIEMEIDDIGANINAWDEDDEEEEDRDDCDEEVES